MGKLTDKGIQAAKPRVARYLMADGDGLTLAVQPSGKKLWWLRYRFGGKPKTLSIGQYPVVSLYDARKQAFYAKQALSDGTDPSAEKKRAKIVLIESKAKEKETVEVIAREWLEKFSVQWTDKHQMKIQRWFEKDVFPLLGKKEIKDAAPSDLLKVVRRVEARGAVDTAHRILQVCGQLWRYAVATGRAERDISQDLRGAIPPAKETHLGAITDPLEIGALLRNIDDYNGSAVVKMALKIAPFVFVRPSELRNAQWSEFDKKKRLWTIPAERMKARRPHVVPLSDQVIALLNELRAVHQNDCLFPTPGSAHRPISDMAMLSAIRRMGYTKEEMTAHGFRAMASTNLEQLGFDSRLIELQLAHSDKDQVRAAYKRETHLMRLEERKEMMQRWASYLDELKKGAQIIPLRA